MVTNYDYSVPPPSSVRTVDINGATMFAATSYAVEGRERYVNGDVFVRYYPGGKAFLGVGFDAHQSWMLNDHFYLGLGGGLKRLPGADERMFALKFIPTLRMNLGVGF
jgi:hypothetical protein